MKTASITVEEVLNLLRRIKSPGPDRIHPRTLWEAKDIAGSLADIYELSLHTDDESEVSSVVNVVPLFKGGKEKPGNYRSVRLTFVVGKLLESILSYNNSQADYTKAAWFCTWTIISHKCDKSFFEEVTKMVHDGGEVEDVALWK